MAPRLLRANTGHDEVHVHTFGNPGRIGYTVEMAAGSEMETMFGPNRTTSPYFSCICRCISWARFVFTHHTRCKLVRLARKGPETCLSRRHVRNSCKVKSDNTTPRSNRVPLVFEKLLMLNGTSLVCTISIMFGMLIKFRSILGLCSYLKPANSIMYIFSRLNHGFEENRRNRGGTLV